MVYQMTYPEKDVLVSCSIELDTTSALIFNLNPNQSALFL